jgi:hypothetical protein
VEQSFTERRAWYFTVHVSKMSGCLGNFFLLLFLHLLTLFGPPLPIPGNLFLKVSQAEENPRNHRPIATASFGLFKVVTSNFTSKNEAQ